MEALLYESDRSTDRADRAGVLIGMGACALSGGIIGFLFGIIVGVWL